MFRSYLKSSLRNMARQPFVSAINIGGLGAGLACCLLILLYLKSELGFDGFHQNAANIFQLVCKRTEGDGKTEQFGIAAMVQGPAFKQAIPGIKEFVRVFPTGTVVKTNAGVFNEEVTWADPAFFKVFSFRVLYGSPAQGPADTHGMALSKSAAIKYFGSADATGKQLELEVNGRFEPFTVKAVLEDAPDNSSIRYNILLPFPYYESLNPDNGWMWVSYPTYLLMAPQADIQAISRQMQQVYERQAGNEISLNRLAGYGNKFEWSARPLASMHLQTAYHGTPYASDPVYAYILGGIALFILAIASINFVNLSIAKSAYRGREIGIRKAAGGNRAQLILQFLCESFMACLLAFALAMVLALIALPAFNALANTRLRLPYLLDYRLLLEMAGLFLLTCLAAGFYPAIVLSGFKPVEALAGKAGARGKARLTKGLVVVQFTAAMVLIIGMFFLYAQFNLLSNTDPGYKDKGLLSFTVSEGIKDKQLMDHYRSVLGNVAGVAGTSYQNIGHFGGKTVANHKEFTATYVRAGEDYPAVMGVQVLAGRPFSTAYAADSTGSALVNETLAKEAGFDGAIGKTIDYIDIPGWGARKLTIVGVVKDFHYESLKEKIPPMVFLEDGTLPLGKMWVRLNDGPVAQALVNLGKAYRQLNPGHPFVYEFAEEANRRAYEPENRWKTIISFGAAVAVVVAVTGLSGLAMLAVQRRKKEISVRKVLGATEAGLVVLVAREFAALVAIAFAIAVPLSFLPISGWLQNYPYRVGFAWWRFALPGLIVFVISMATVAFQAAGTALARPSVNLKNL